jgi:hypothetical protein
MAQPLGRRLRPARRHGLTSPDPVRTPDGPRGHPETPTPAQDPVDKPQNRQRQEKHARKPLVEASDRNRGTRHSAGGRCDVLAIDLRRNSSALAITGSSTISLSQ